MWEIGQVFMFMLYDDVFTGAPLALTSFADCHEIELYWITVLRISGILFLFLMSKHELNKGPHHHGTYGYYAANTTTAWKWMAVRFRLCSDGFGIVRCVCVYL